MSSRSRSRSRSPTGATSPTHQQSLQSHAGNIHMPHVRSRLWQTHAPGLQSNSEYGSFSQSRIDISDSEGSIPPGGSRRTSRVASGEVDSRRVSRSSIKRRFTDPERSRRISGSHRIEGQEEGAHANAARAVGDTTEAGGEVDNPVDRGESAHDALLRYAQQHVCGDENCDHGTFSPRAPTFGSIGSMDDRASLRSRDSFRAALGAGRHAVQGIGEAIADGIFGSDSRRGTIDGDEPPGGKANTMWLVRRHGIKHRRRMFLTYYFPFAKWITQYRLSYLKGDLIAAITMASFYIPMALSYADNLAHLPPINGLYAFVFNPLIYAFFGTCPQMVVGPEAPGSLLVGSVVRTSIDKGHIGDDSGMLAARVAGVITGMAGFLIFVAGLTRLGFLDSVLSRPFLRGFISAIGVVILADQLVPEMGLTDVARDAGAGHGSSVEKIIFLVENVKKAHPLTCYVSFGAFAVIMLCRELKKKYQSRYPNLVYIPDRFIIVVLSAVLTYTLRLDRKGLEVLGDVRSSTGGPFTFHWPFIPSHMIHIREAMSTSFLIALLGFFESSVAAKSLGGGEKKPGEGIRGIALSANRELVALGIANIVGGCFMALPAFGGYGRSKVNASTGGKTPMSSIFLSLFTLLCIMFVLPWFYYLPKGVLSAMVSVVAYSLIEECPHDILFFVRIRGYSELGLMALIFLATVFYSLPLGIALGMGLSLLRVIKHATRPRIQVLGKVPGTGTSPSSPPVFENAEDNPSSVEFVEGVLIVKIPEPLTFANTGDLKNRLRRLELYGTTSAHPALPRIRDEYHNQNIVFDVHGVTSLDGAGAQVLAEIVDGYIERGVRVFFCRVPGKRGDRDGKVMTLMNKAGIVEKCGGRESFVTSVDEALRLAAKRVERYRDAPDEEEV